MKQDPIELYAKLQPLIQKEIQQAAVQLRAEFTQYGVSKAPSHSHNGIDLPQIPPTSLSNVETLSAQTGSVLAGNACTNMKSPVAVFPLPVLTSAPSGSGPDGAMVAAVVSGVLRLYVCHNNTWQKIGPLLP